MLTSAILLGFVMGVIFGFGAGWTGIVWQQQRELGIPDWVCGLWAGVWWSVMGVVFLNMLTLWNQFNGGVLW